jgi:4-carboxymuconolactone decarboxylase
VIATFGGGGNLRVASGLRALCLTTTIVAAVGVAAVVPCAAQPLPIENIQLRGDRFRGLHYRDMTDEQRALLYNIVNSARAVTNTTGNGPFNVLLRTPQVGELSQQLGNAIRFSSGLSGRLRELATLMAGRAWTSTYEWYAHERYARDEGIDRAVIEAIAQHREPNLAAMPIEDTMVWRVADELLYTRSVTDATYAEALTVLGERRLLSSATIAAYYEYVSMLLNVDRYPLPSDAPLAAVAATRALAILPADALYRAPSGSVTPRRLIPNADTERAIAALGASVERDAELPRDLRDVARSAVLLEWNRIVDREVPRTAGASAAQQLAAELLRTRFVSDATFAAALDALGERGLVNLIVLMGHSNIRCAQQALAGSACVL